MQVDVFAPGKGYPVRIEYGFSRRNVTDHPLGGLLPESMVCQASPVVLHISKISAAAAGRIPGRLSCLIAVNDGPVLMDKHDREGEIVPKEMEIAVDFFTDFILFHNLAPL